MCGFLWEKLLFFLGWGGFFTLFLFVFLCVCFLLFFCFVCFVLFVLFLFLFFFEGGLRLLKFGSFK